MITPRARSHRHRVVTVLCMLTAPVCCAPISPTPTPLRSFGAWITSWDFNNGLRDVVGAPAALQDVFIFGANLDRDGAPVLPPGLRIDEGTLKQLREQRRRVWLTVVNDVVTGPSDTAPVAKDPAVVTRAIATSEAREQHAARIVDLAHRLGFDGIDVDYENLRAADRVAFSQLVERVAVAAHARGLRLSVTVQPKQRETNADGPGAADWRALCAHADRLHVMLYNEHSGKTGPGPISSSPWITKVLSFAQTECPREKIVPVLKVSGAVWSGGATRGIQHDEANTLALASGQRIERDAIDQTPHYSYERDRVRYTVYFEDAVSIRSKSTTVRQLGYDRLTLWSVGRHDPALFGVLLER